jgi:5-methylcytosine-specific restriction endonuclease McrA
MYPVWTPGEPLCLLRANQVELPHPPPRDETVPLTSDLRRLHVTVSKRFLDKLEAARSALSHSLPGATTEQILEAALDLLLAKDAKRKGLVVKPRPAATTAPEPGIRYVPAAVRRSVWKRDAGKCQWPLEGGGICGSTYQVELDHTRPVRQGGRSTVDGTRLLCKPHNDEAARRAYGDAWMDRFTRRRGTGTG